MAEEYPVLQELETKLKLQWVDTNDYLATQRALIQVEPEAAYLELPRGPKGDPGPAISFEGIVARTSHLPTGLTAADAAKAWINTTTKALHVWNGDSWLVVNDFAGVDADSAVARAYAARDAAEAAAQSVTADAEQTGLDRTQTGLDRQAVASAKSYIDQQVDAIDTAFTESIPPYLQADSPNGLRATYALSEQRVVNVFHKGVSPLNSPEDNLAAFQAAIDEAPDGATIVMPSTSPNEVVRISGSITPRPGMTLSGIGGRAYLAQETWGAPVFDLPYGEVTLRHWDVRSVPNKSAISGTFRDGSATNAATVVWLGGHRGHLEDIKGTGFASVCRATPWDAQAGALGEFSEGHTFENIEVSGCDWGIVGSGWYNATLRNITGVYNTRDGSSDPGHLVYIASQRASRDVSIADCAAFNGTGGRAYSFKNIKGLNAVGLSATSCEGLLDYQGIEYATLDGLRALDDMDSSPDGCIYGFGGDLNMHLNVSNVTLEIHPSARGVRADGNRGSWKNITVVTNRTTTEERYDIEIHGSENVLDMCEVWNKSEYAFRFIGIAGQRNQVLRPRAKNTRLGINVRPQDTGTVLEYDPSVISFSTSSENPSILTNQAADCIIRMPRSVEKVSTAGGSVRGRSSTMSVMEVEVTGSGDITVSSPYDRPSGHVVTYEITNSTESPTGSISFTGTHVTNGAPSPVPAGKTSSYTFRYEFTANVWREVGRQEA